MANTNADEEPSQVITEVTCQMSNIGNPMSAKFVSRLVRSLQPVLMFLSSPFEDQVVYRSRKSVYPLAAALGSRMNKTREIKSVGVV